MKPDMKFDEKMLDRMLGRIEAQVHKVLDQRGTKPQSAEKTIPNGNSQAFDPVTSIKSEAIRLFLECCR
jgi:hypothetical protein